MGKAANLLWIGLLGLTVGTGCQPQPSAPAVRLESPDPGERIRSIMTVADQGEGADIPRLVDRLDDEDESVRFFAIAALARLTGQRFGYRPFDPPLVRRESVVRWREYVDQLGSEQAKLVKGQSKE